MTTVKDIKDYTKDTSKETAELKKEIAELRLLVEKQARHTGAQAGNTIDAAKSSVAALAADAGARARNLLDNKKDQAAHLAEDGKVMVQKNPMESVGLAFLAGMILPRIFFGR